jgi:hypothetical protein
MAPWEEEMRGRLGFDVWLQVLEKGGDGRGGGGQESREWGGRLPTPMQAPNQRNSTALLVNVFPQIPNSQNATTEREEKKQKEYPPTSLLCKPGITPAQLFRRSKLIRKSGT